MTGEQQKIASHLSAVRKTSRVRRDLRRKLFPPGLGGRAVPAKTRLRGYKFFQHSKGGSPWQP
jgi:hypothetical protein